jgi:hypothetical protein
MLYWISDVVSYAWHFSQRPRRVLVDVVENQSITAVIGCGKATLGHGSQRTFINGR